MNSLNEEIRDDDYSIFQGVKNENQKFNQFYFIRNNNYCCTFSAILNNHKSKVDHSKDLPSNENSVLVNNNAEIAKQAKDVS